MKDWKACVRTWESNDSNCANGNNAGNKSAFDLSSVAQPKANPEMLNYLEKLDAEAKKQPAAAAAGAKC